MRTSCRAARDPIGGCAAAPTHQSQYDIPERTRSLPSAAHWRPSRTQSTGSAAIWTPRRRAPAAYAGCQAGCRADADSSPGADAVASAGLCPAFSRLLGQQRPRRLPWEVAHTLGQRTRSPALHRSFHEDAPRGLRPWHMSPPRAAASPARVADGTVPGASKACRRDPALPRGLSLKTACRGRRRSPPGCPTAPPRISRGCLPVPWWPPAPPGR
mmetsp:Transcript_15523/g.59000  ORF Transcript_15523/g.59000 Transcript_15523/m.59000 type:complete len:214 (+) Transcript_15523:323-964(+)